MKTTSKLLQLNQKTFTRFVHLKTTDKQQWLKSKGLLVDKDHDKQQVINLYYLKGFFVEEILSVSGNTLIDIIPYKHGFKSSSFVELKETLVPKHNPFVNHSR